MKVILTFEVEVNEEEHRLFLIRWPGFAPETAESTLIREAVAAWDYEGLVVPHVVVNGRVVE